MWDVVSVILVFADNVCAAAASMQRTWSQTLGTSNTMKASTRVQNRKNRALLLLILEVTLDIERKFPFFAA